MSAALRSIVRRRDAGAALPLSALLALAMTGFTAIATETLPAGLLPAIARGLGVTEAAAGQLVTAYACGSLVAALPLTAWTQRFRRRPTLLATIAGFLLANTVTALSSSFWLTLAARFLAGVAAGLAWGMLSGYARRMVAEPLRGRALAIAMLGTPVALSLGVPAGAFLGSVAGWRPVFLLMSATGVVLIGWVLHDVPDFAGQAGREQRSVLEVFATPGVRPVLATVLAWMAAHNLLYTYVAALAARAGLGGRVDLLLFGFGVAALGGLSLTGLLIDRALRPLLLTSLVVFAAAALLLGLFGRSSVAVCGGTLAWGLAFGGAATQLQTAAAEASGENVDLASAMVTTAWNAAIAVGGFLGGVMLNERGAPSLPWAALALAAVALLIVVRRPHAAATSGLRE